jgi:parallel beta-helix repeat protein
LPRRHLRPYPATLVSLAVILALAVVGVIVLSGGGALASHVGCGDKITRDTRLDSDLVDCPNNGIVIGADGVTLNLNGHTIDGDGTPAAGCNPRRKICDVGVVTVGHDGVTVRRGSVREFNVGVFVGNARRTHLMGLSSSANRFPGVVILNSPRTLVRDGTFIGNGLHTDTAGLDLHDSPDGRFLHNAFRHNGDIGMFVEGSNRNRIEDNLFSRHPEAGILIEGSRNEMRRNRLSRNGVGIDVGGNGNVIARNRVSDSRAPRGGDGPGVGILLSGRDNVIARNRVHRAVGGIAIEVGRGNLVARNVVVGARRIGIRLGIGGPFPGGGSNLVRRNLVRGGGGDGFLVNEKEDHSLLRRNLAVGAGDDGFDVRSRTTKLTGNRAFRNADLGIEAVRGVSDGGGNVARRNGDRRQCLNVECQ